MTPLNTSITIQSPRPLNARPPIPRELVDAFPLSDLATRRIAQTRSELVARLKSRAGRRIVVVGPCSIHSEEAAHAYADKLLPVARRLENDLLIIMRAYFEKPRTAVGWKGFLYDPDLDGSCDLNQGLRRSRRLLAELAELGIPLATEVLDPLTSVFFQDCLSWAAIGARTCESQIHRQAASGMACPVGFKNATDGSLDAALAAIQAAAVPHNHLGIDERGQLALVSTSGNRATHIVLRGGHSGPNYCSENLDHIAPRLARLEASPGVLIDCSHENSGKDPRRQPAVARAVMAQFARSDVDILGVMIESHVHEGRQECSPKAAPGQSVTDACLGFSETEALLEELASAHRKKAWPACRAPGIQALRR